MSLTADTMTGLMKADEMIFGITMAGLIMVVALAMAGLAMNSLVMADWLKIVCGWIGNGFG